MKITTVADAGSKPNPHGVQAKTIYDRDHAVITHMMILPGQALKKHVTPVDVAFYVLSGRGEVEIGEEKEVVGKDTIVESPLGIPHTLANPFDEPFSVLVMKLPRPSEKSRLVNP